MLTISTLLALLAAEPAQADFGDYRRHAMDQQTLAIDTSLGQLRITPVDDAAFEVHYVENGVKQLPSFALAGAPPDVESAVAESDSFISFAVDGLIAVIDKSPVRISYASNGSDLVAEASGYFADSAARGFRFQLDDGEKILGGGERVLGMDRRGKRMPLYNKAAYGYETHAEQMYYGLPAVMSSDKYLIVFDNSANGWLDIGHTDANILSFEAMGGRTAYLIIAGDDYPDLIENYTAVTGRQPLPPRWAFGNFASRFGYHSEQEVRDVVRRFQKRDIPLDAVIIDIFWFGPDIKSHMGNLDWDRNAFPDPENMIADFLQQGVKTIVVTEPFILSTSRRWQDAVANEVLALDSAGEPRRFDFYFGNTGLVDVFNESARQWFWAPYRMLFSQGIAASWGDLGEPEVHPADALHWLSEAGVQATGDEIHNAFGHVWTKMLYERQVAAYPEMRPLIMMRSGFAGTQRYGIIPWTGDVKRSWDGLKPQIELSLQMGLFGLAYTHSDLGGFADGEEFDREMYIRWLQYGVFQPVYRPHAQEHIAAEPVFHDRKTRNIVREFVKLRYRLLPYNYTLAYENSTTGMPLMRPLFFENETDPDLIDEREAYLWGDAFLVAPVMDAGVSAVDVPLPAGAWFDFWADTRYEGSQTVSIPVTLETIPVLVRAGSFVPMTADMQTTRDYNKETLILHYYADRSVPQSSGQMYEDDGTSRQSLEHGAFELLHFDATQRDATLSIEFSRTGGLYAGRPQSRRVELVIHNWIDDVDLARFNGDNISHVVDPNSRTLRLGFDWAGDAARLDINSPPAANGRAVVYQVFTRLFGNQNSNNVPWGTNEENGVGKFGDFTDAALRSIRALGVTHIWYTGIPHHAVIRDYTAYGISNDDPDVVKGRAGSPYAIKDYYNVNPDLATDPAQRLAEFDALIERTHRNGMQVIIDIVPNHVARAYHSTSAPAGVEDFGARDDTSVAWARDNNFYYVVGEDFAVPESPPDYAPLGGDPHPLADAQFAESPAKWTGNGSRAAQPQSDDWFETVKINFGVRPDGSLAFDRLPDAARHWSTREHVAFWADKDVPDSWRKFRDVVLYWLARGVDGFRYDTAELVPVEVWSYLNSAIKTVNPDAFLIAEVYNPSLYRDYIDLGRMDYLYDKVGLYDTLKAVMQGKSSTDAIAATQGKLLDIEQHMLHFLENHDEQRISSPAFAGDPRKAKPAMVVSALLGSAPTMLYFAQELGEPGDGDAGFGDPTRTTIFDYWGVPTQQRWMNGGQFDGGASTADETELRDFYARLLNLSTANPAFTGKYAEIHSVNRQGNAGCHEPLFSFVRWSGEERLIIVSNFSATTACDTSLQLPPAIVSEWQLGPGRFVLDDLLHAAEPSELVVDGGKGSMRIKLGPLESAVYRVGDGAFKSRLDVNLYLQDIDNANIVGKLITWRDVESSFLGEPRHVQVWLPPGYDENPERHYPVIYMSDGENLFDPRIASWGTDWGIDEAMSRGVESGDFEPAIVVAVWSTSNRSTEYSPWHDAASYARFLIEDLQPRVNSTFRTRTGPENTSAMGSSAGALLAYYLVKEHPDSFGACGCVSTHFPVSPAAYARISGAESTDADDTPYVLSDIAAGATVPAGARFYFDYGTQSHDAEYGPTHAAVREWLLAQGLHEGTDFRIREVPGATHNEAAWRARVGDQLQWLLRND
jgi:oligosaccharide 4-alpha-D-glucosyltransferase